MACAAGPEKDFTIGGLVSEFAERGLKVDYRSVWNFVHAEKLSFERARAEGRLGFQDLDDARNRRMAHRVLK